MTNIVATATILLVTNWTGVVSDSKELGYVTTNHQVTVRYQDLTNSFEIKREIGSWAVWRPRQQLYIITNDFRSVWPHVVLTNGMLVY